LEKVIYTLQLTSATISTNAPLLFSPLVSHITQFAHSNRPLMFVKL